MRTCNSLHEPQCAVMLVVKLRYASFGCAQVALLKSWKFQQGKNRGETIRLAMFGGLVSRLLFSETTQNCIAPKKYPPTSIDNKLVAR